MTTPSDPALREHAHAPGDVALDPSDPYARQGQTFPRLGPEQIERIAGYGTEERVAAGTTLFQQGDRGVDFFVVVDGTVEIFELDPHGQPSVIVVHGEREFTGELDLFNDRRVLVGGRAGSEATVIRVAHREFRHMLGNEPDIAEVVTRAFILRRVGLIRHAQAGAVLIGSPHAAETQRIVRFMTYNGHPHRVIDIDESPEAASFLTCFEIDRSRLFDARLAMRPGKPVLQSEQGTLVGEAGGFGFMLDGNGKVLGVVDAIELDRARAGGKVEALSADYVSVPPGAKLIVVARSYRDGRPIAVIDEQGRFIGSLGADDILARIASTAPGLDSAGERHVQS